MRYFQVPFNINDEDKIIGGYMSLRQFGWIIAAGTIVALAFLGDRSYMIIHKSSAGPSSITFNYIGLTIRLIISIATVILSALCAFLKVDDIYNFDSYLIKMIKFKFRNKVFKYKK